MVDDKWTIECCGEASCIIATAASTSIISPAPLAEGVPFATVVGCIGCGGGGGC